MPKRWVIPDIHGYVNTVRSLITDLIKPMRSDELYFLGDYVDRGPDSKGVIDFIRSLENEKYNITVLKGNHEDYMVELYDTMKNSKNSWWFKFGNKKYKSWSEIGGKPTLQSFNTQHILDVPSEYIEWMRNLVYFVELDDFVLVHAGLNFKNEDPFEDKHAMLWLRDYPIIPEKIGGRRIIHGHVPVNMELITLAIRNRIYKFIDIDNGPYITGREGFGNMVALELNSMEMVIQYNMDI
ncbi:MAG: metallophosphoesterase [Bacteroidales bacterium]|jgi:serine/threonine protein phosphatase 1|nr:metallophosphoesterase [Bacteroidales bacterium]